MLLQLLRRFNAHTQHTARQDPAHRDEQTQENPQNDDQRFFRLDWLRPGHGRIDNADVTNCARPGDAQLLFAVKQLLVDNASRLHITAQAQHLLLG